MKKNILKILIISLCISALIGIIIILTGKFGKLESKILLTTLSIFIFSIPSLCCSTIYDKDKKLSKIGIIISILANIISILLIWKIIDRNIIIPWKFLITLILLSNSLGHISLLLLLNSNKITKIVRNITITLSIIIDLILLLIIWFNIEFISFRIILILIILITLGTITSPILNKIYKNNP